MCMASENCKLQERVDAIDQRVTRLETRMADGFQTVTAAVNQLASDFGQRMNLIEKKVVDEKAKEAERRHGERAKWNDCLRGILTKAAYVLLGLAATAGGMTCYKAIFCAGG